MRDLKLHDLEIESLILKSRQREWENYLPEGNELNNQLLLAKLMTESALKRYESLGAHYRSDYQNNSVKV